MSQGEFVNEGKSPTVADLPSVNNVDEGQIIYLETSSGGNSKGYYVLSDDGNSLVPFGAGGLTTFTTLPAIDAVSQGDIIYLEAVDGVNAIGHYTLNTAGDAFIRLHNVITPTGIEVVSALPTVSDVNQGAIIYLDTLDGVNTIGHYTLNTAGDAFVRLHNQITPTGIEVVSALPAVSDVNQGAIIYLDTLDGVNTIGHYTLNTAGDAFVRLHNQITPTGIEVVSALPAVSDVNQGAIIYLDTLDGVNTIGHYTLNTAGDAFVRLHNQITPTGIEVVSALPAVGDISDGAIIYLDTLDGANTIGHYTKSQDGTSFIKLHDPTNTLPFDRWVENPDVAGVSLYAYRPLQTVEYKGSFYINKTDADIAAGSLTPNYDYSWTRLEVHLHSSDAYVREDDLEYGTVDLFAGIVPYGEFGTGEALTTDSSWSNLTDGDSSTGSDFFGTEVHGNVRVVIELPFPKRISQFTITENTTNYPEEFYIEGSHDGNVWETLSDVVFPRGAFFDFSDALTSRPVSGTLDLYFNTANSVFNYQNPPTGSSTTINFNQSVSYKYYSLMGIRMNDNDTDRMSINGLEGYELVSKVVAGSTNLAKEATISYTGSGTASNLPLFIDGSLTSGGSIVSITTDDFITITLKNATQLAKVVFNIELGMALGSCSIILVDDNSNEFIITDNSVVGTAVTQTGAGSTTASLPSVLNNVFSFDPTGTYLLTEQGFIILFDMPTIVKAIKVVFKSTSGSTIDITDISLHAREDALNNLTPAKAVAEVSSNTGIGAWLYDPDLTFRSLRAYLADSIVFYRGNLYQAQNDIDRGSAIPTSNSDWEVLNFYSSDITPAVTIASESDSSGLNTDDLELTVSATGLAVAGRGGRIHLSGGIGTAGVSVSLVFIKQIDGTWVWQGLVGCTSAGTSVVTGEGLLASSTVVTSLTTGTKVIQLTVERSSTGVTFSLLSGISPAVEKYLAAIVEY